MTPSFSARINSESTRSFPTGGGFSLELEEARPGFIRILADGPSDAVTLLSEEGGGHRWQRRPPTEKRGRVHTSTITVATLPWASEHTVKISSRDLDIQATRGSGKGGQKRNVTANAVRVVHRPSGIAVRVESERSQHQNRQRAIEAIRAALAAREAASRDHSRGSHRRSQVGSGMRGDKRRTIRVRDNRVTDHRTGRRTTVGRFLRGHLEDLV